MQHMSSGVLTLLFVLATGLTFSATSLIHMMADVDSEIDSIALLGITFPGLGFVTGNDTIMIVALILWFIVAVIMPFKIQKFTTTNKEINRFR